MKTKKSQNKEFPGYYIAPPIKKMLDNASIQVKKKDWDRVYIIDGEEGVGKSLLGLQFAYYLDPTLSLDRITFTGTEFSKAITTAETNQAIIFDEAFNGLTSTSATSKLNRLIVSKLMECRQKNLFIFIILPTIFLLQKYASIFRSRCLFHVYVTKSGNRGYYRIYNKKNKKILYLLGNKMYSYSKPYVKNSFRYYGKYPIDEEAYRKKKFESLRGELEEEKIDKYARRFGLLAGILKKEKIMTYSLMSDKLKEHNCEINYQNISRIAQKVLQ